VWILLIISFIPEHNEYRGTEFNRYNTQQQCDINLAVLQVSFEDNEGAVCYYENTSN